MKIILLFDSPEDGCLAGYHRHYDLSDKYCDILKEGKEVSVTFCSPHTGNEVFHVSDNTSQPELVDSRGNC